MADCIVATCKPQRVILFGSRARGTARPRSDADFLVVVPQERHSREQMVAVLDALAEFPIASDVVLTTPDDLADFSVLPTFVHYYAQRDGIVLYEQP
jgi:predicted nucleotidyltransferase